MEDEKLIEGMEKSKEEGAKEETPKEETPKGEVPKEEGAKEETPKEKDSKEQVPKEEGSKDNVPNEEKKQKRKIRKVKPPDKLKVMMTAIVIIVAGYIGYKHNYESSAFLGPLIYGKEKEPYTLNDWLTLVFLISCCAFSLVILDKSYNPMSSIKKKNTNKKEKQDDDKQPSEEEVVSRYKDEDDDKPKDDSQVNDQVKDDKPKDGSQVTDQPKEDEFNTMGISLDDLISSDDKFPIP